MGNSDQAPGKLASTAIRGASWTYLAYYSGKLTIFLSTIVLARLLTKGDYGVVGYALTIIGFIDVVKDLGIGLAVIYHDDEKVADTAFWLNLLIALGLFLLIWISSPLVGAFFRDERAVAVTRTLALNFPLGAVGATHEALLIKRLAFNRKFIPDFARAMSKGILSIGLAFMGFGPWSLIYGQLFGTIVSVFILWGLVNWRPAITFSGSAAQSLLNFGLPIVGVNIVSVFALNLDYLMVGRYLGAEALGVYTLAFRIPELILLQFCVIVAQVIFPVFTKIRDDVDALRRGFLETARYVALFTVPIGLGMALLAESFILTFFGEKWLEAAPVMRAISLYGLFISLGYNAGDVYKAQGRPGMLTRISILHVLLLAPALVWAINFFGNIVAVGWAQAVIALIVSMVYLTIALKMLSISFYSLLNVLKTPFAPALGLTLTVIAVVYLLDSVAPWVQLGAGVFAGGAAYIGLLYWMERKVVVEAMGLIRKILVR